MEDDDEEEEADKMKPVSPVVHEIKNTLIQQDAACRIVIDNDQTSFILKSNTNKIK